VVDELDRKKRDFALGVAKKIAEKLAKEVAVEPTKQARKLTNIHLRVAFEAVDEVMIANPPFASWPANIPPIEVSAHGRTEWLSEELLADTKYSGRVSVGPCRGQPVDLQVRQNGHVVVSVESELGGAQERNRDHQKLTGHSEVPLASVIMVREMSGKHIPGVLRGLQKDSAARPEPYINVVEHWRKNTTLDTSTPFITVTQGGNEIANSQTNFEEAKGADEGQADDFEGDDEIEDDEVDDAAADDVEDDEPVED
jgi:hypothetical protein